VTKPDWKDAPEWAQWLAQEASGLWWWYQTRPRWVGKIWIADGWTVKQKVILTGEYHANPDWKETLEERPCTPNT